MLKEIPVARGLDPAHLRNLWNGFSPVPLAPPTHLSEERGKRGHFSLSEGGFELIQDFHARSEGQISSAASLSGKELSSQTFCRRAHISLHRAVGNATGEHFR